MSAVAEGRRAAESRMLSRVTVRRRSGSTTTDGIEGDSFSDVYTNLPFRLSSSDGGTHSVSIGATTYQAATAVGHFPASTTDLADDDLIEVTRGEWSGSVFRIVEAVKGDQKTARRVPIVEA